MLLMLVSMVMKLWRGRVVSINESEQGFAASNYLSPIHWHVTLNETKISSPLWLHHVVTSMLHANISLKSQDT